MIAPGLCREATCILDAILFGRILSENTNIKDRFCLHQLRRTLVIQHQRRTSVGTEILESLSGDVAAQSFAYCDSPR